MGFIRSSSGVVRGFCKRCASPLTFKYLLQLEKIFVTAGTLVFPDRITPEENIHWNTHFRWGVDVVRLPARVEDIDTAAPDPE